MEKESNGSIKEGATPQSSNGTSVVTAAGAPGNSLSATPTGATPMVSMGGSDKENKKIRLVYYGDAPCVATGFGKVSKNILGPLHATGRYEIYCFGVNYMGVPHPFPFQIYPMLPNPQGDPYGREKIKQIIPQMDFDLLFMLQDSFIMTFIPDLVNELRSRGKRFKSLVYFPIDGEPESEWIEAMSHADQCVTYTEYGYKQCVNKFPSIQDKLHIIPHGISLQEFFPKPPEEIAKMRQFYFGPHANKFIVMNVNRNQQRKDLPRTMLAFREFKKQCPNSVYYMHCAEKDVGWDLRKVARNIGLTVGEDVIFPKNFNVNTGLPVSVVNDLYNCANVVISACVGEGWGLSSVEAMATGTPAIFPDNTSLTEIFADGRGFLCRSGDTPNFYTFMTMDNEVARPLTNINDMVKYLKRLYEKPEIGFKMAQKSLDWVRSSLQWEQHIVPKFDSLLQGLYSELQSPHTGIKVGEQKSQDGSSDWKRGQLV